MIFSLCRIQSLEDIIWKTLWLGYKINGTNLFFIQCSANTQDFPLYQILILFLNNSEVFHEAFLQKCGWNLLFWKTSHEIQAEFIWNPTWLLSFPLILTNKIFIEFVPTHSEHNWNVKDFPYCKFRAPNQTTLLGCPK